MKITIDVDTILSGPNARIRKSTFLKAYGNAGSSSNFQERAVIVGSDPFGDRKFFLSLEDADLDEGVMKVSEWVKNEFYPDKDELKIK